MRFLHAIGQDPVLASVKLITEPWDRRLPGWSEWNDQFRDTLRGYWRGDPGKLPVLAQVITGSREIFEASGRQAWASIQSICTHDGFTLHAIARSESIGALRDEVAPMLGVAIRSGSVSFGLTATGNLANLPA
jgi:pullulanase/glycogen debranching enzyme